MDAGPFEALALVEAVSVRALLAGVEVKLSGALGTAELGKPSEQGGSVAAAASLGERDEIVDVQVATPREALAEAKAGHGYRIATVAQGSESVARALL